MRIKANPLYRDLIKLCYSHKMQKISRSIRDMEIFRGLAKFLLNFIDLLWFFHRYINDISNHRSFLLLKKEREGGRWRNQWTISIFPMPIVVSPFQEKFDRKFYWIQINTKSIIIIQLYIYIHIIVRIFQFYFCNNIWTHTCILYAILV